MGGLDGLHLDAFRAATDGDTSVDLAFLHTHPHAIGAFGPPPTLLSATAITCVSALLEEIDIRGILAALPTDDRDARSLIGRAARGFAGDPTEYLLEHFQALRKFYGEASRRGLLVVLWWD